MLLMNTKCLASLGVPLTPFKRLSPSRAAKLKCWLKTAACKAATSNIRQDGVAGVFWIVVCCW